jgi:hypothetical protein
LFYHTIAPSFQHSNGELAWFLLVECMKDAAMVFKDIRKKNVKQHI